jgi:hypothetical protein
MEKVSIWVDGLTMAEGKGRDYIVTYTSVRTNKGTVGHQPMLPFAGWDNLQHATM